MKRTWDILDGNEAAASVAYRTNEVIAIYPITPASPMGELADAWSVQGRRNLWDSVPQVVQMQSEAGAIGAVHGSLQAGALTTTFTASQGLLLMIPNLYKIAGELTACCIHVAARSVATHALSIFGDHSDVMAVRQTGCGLLASGSVQEAHDLACIGQAASLRSRIPFLHFFDGFRTSHELSRIEVLSDENLRKLIRKEWLAAHRDRALTPDAPVLRGTAQNPDAFFQAREACNLFYEECPGLVQKTMVEFAAVTGREYRLFDYVGHPQAERVVVIMGSGAETVEETVMWLMKKGERVGVLKVRLYRPFSLPDFIRTLPRTTRQVAVLDRTKEPGAVGEPLYLDVVGALREGWNTGGADPDVEPRVVGGRYGLSSKEFTPAMVKSVFDNLTESAPRKHFSVGIVDDVTHASLEWDRELDIEAEDVVRAVFYGLGSDGTVGANKNSIKIIGEATDRFVQGYFVYDSKKAGATTVSHLRFSPRPVRAPFLIKKAQFVACHQFDFLGRFDVLEFADSEGVFLLNSPYGPAEVWDHLPREVQEGILEKNLEFHVIDAYRIATENGLGVRINTIMQMCFFSIAGILPPDEAVARIKESIQKTYSKRGSLIVRQNLAAVDETLQHLGRVKVPGRASAQRSRPPVVPAEAPDFVQRVTAVLMANKGDLLPVSAFPVDGTWPVGTARWEKRNLAREIPVWDPEICVQCNHCVLLCPHAAIRAKVYEPLEEIPDGFLSTPYRGAEFPGSAYTIQVAPEDCTGCYLCAVVCPAKDKSNPRHKALDMVEQSPILERERNNYRFFLEIPDMDRTRIHRLDAKGTQFMEPLFEYSGACPGCGETPYIKLLTQLFGDRLFIANATGCSSIYGGNLPTTPYTVNREGRGPAWSNSLFEDNAEFGLGFRLAVDAHREQAGQLLRQLSSKIGEDLAGEILEADQGSEEGIKKQRRRVELLKEKLGSIRAPEAARLSRLADYLVRKSVWLVGGDGWAYDIGSGGLDHILSQNRDVNILVLDTEVYSNTGGQQSKATPLGAAAKFAIAGKSTPKKDLGLEAISYGHAYVARVAMGANMNQVAQAFIEAESYSGPSLIIAYSPCIAHGYDLRHGAEQQKLAVRCGVWPLYRFDPRRAAAGKPPLHLDSGEPKIPVSQYMQNETRFQMTEKIDPRRFERLAAAAQKGAASQFSIYRQLAGLTVPVDEEEESPQHQRT